MSCQLETAKLADETPLVPEATAEEALAGTNNVVEAELLVEVDEADAELNVADVCVEAPELEALIVVPLETVEEGLADTVPEEVTEGLTEPGDAELETVTPLVKVV